jgi:hypothetical protein
MSWSPHSPDLTLPDFSSGEFIKDFLYQPQLPTHVQELKNIITAAIVTVTPDMLHRALQETDYRWDVCRHHLWQSSSHDGMGLCRLKLVNLLVS